MSCKALTLKGYRMSLNGMRMGGSHKSPPEPNDKWFIIFASLAVVTYVGVMVWLIFW